MAWTDITTHIQKFKDKIAWPVVLLNNSGAPFGFKMINDKPRISCKPFLHDVGKGNVTTHKLKRILGYNADVDDEMETLWNVGGMYGWPSAAQRMEVVSSSANDDLTGTHAQKVHLDYLDASYVEQSETIELDGATPVATTADDILRILDFHVSQVGAASQAFAAGNIDIRHLSNLPIFGRIQVGDNRLLQAVHTVPTGKAFYVTGWQVGIGNSSGNRMGVFRLNATCDRDTPSYTEGIMQHCDIIVAQDGTVEVAFHCPIKVPAQSDISITVISDAANANAICAGHFVGWEETV